MNINTSEKTPFEKQPLSTQETFVQSATKVPVQLQSNQQLAAQFPYGRGTSRNPHKYRRKCIQKQPKIDGCGGMHNGKPWCMIEGGGSDYCERYDNYDPNKCKEECRWWRTKKWCYKQGGGWKWCSKDPVSGRWS